MRGPRAVVRGGIGMFQNLPNAQLILYPDSNYGAQYQYPELFVKHVTQFLKG